MKRLIVYADGTPVPHEQFPIGKATTYTPERSSYSRAFANDPILAYGNNRGSVELRVEREEGSP